MTKYLLELGVEEFPGSYIKGTKDQLKKKFADLFKEENIGYESLEVQSTPRRFALLVSGLSQGELESVELVRGPSATIAYADGQPTKALEGFLRGQGLELEDVMLKDEGGTEYVYVEKVQRLAPIPEILEANLPEIIKSLRFPKTMKWGGKSFRFARPLRWVLSVYDDQALTFDLEGIPVSNVTRGHRVLGSDHIIIDKIDDYSKKLLENGVMVDEEERKNIILAGSHRLAREHGGNLFQDDELLEEVINLVEYPTPLLGDINPKYLSLPQEVIITAMKDHQRYFPILNDGGELMPHFITVRNGDDKGLDQVKKGNEKVISPRLEDGIFFYQEDLKEPLEYYVDVLKTATFHEDLGSIYEKSQRVQKLVKLLGEQLAIGEEAIKNSQRAAYLSKADLVTKLVVEFPELQGTMGEIYARESGESEIVSKAIREQYLPRYSGDILPESTAGMILSIADKIDTLVGMYATGVRVTGSQDPYALRRSTLGILNIIIENKLDFDLREIVSDSLYIYLKDNQLVFDYEETIAEIMDFFSQRLRVKLIDEGNRYDVVDACFDTDSSNVYYIYRRVKATNKWVEELNEETLQTLVRVENIAKDSNDLEVLEELLAEDAEKNLFAKFYVLEEVNDHIDKKKFNKALATFDGITDEINSFLDNTMVMVDDEEIRSNRLGLLNRVYMTVKRLFRPSKIVQ